MASVASSGASPLSGYEFPQAPESTDDPDENQWTLFSVPNSSGPNSAAGFFPSPAASAAISLGSSWGIVGHDGQLQPSPTAASPLNLNLDSFDQQSLYQQSSFVDQSGQFVGIPSTQAETQFIPDTYGQDGEALLASATEGMSDQQLNGMGGFTPRLRVRTELIKANRVEQISLPFSSQLRRHLEVLTNRCLPLTLTFPRTSSLHRTCRHGTVSRPSLSWKTQAPYHRLRRSSISSPPAHLRA